MIALVSTRRLIMHRPRLGRQWWDGRCRRCGHRFDLHGNWLQRAIYWWRNR